MLYILLIKCAVGNSGLRCLYFYSKAYIEEAHRRGIVIDRLWVGHSKIWRIKGMEGVPYIKPWKDVLIKRSLATILYPILELALAGVAVLIG